MRNSSNSSQFQPDTITLFECHELERCGIGMSVYKHRKPRAFEFSELLVRRDAAEERAGVARRQRWSFDSMELMLHFQNRRLCVVKVDCFTSLGRNKLHQIVKRIDHLRISGVPCLNRLYGPCP